MGGPDYGMLDAYRQNIEDVRIKPRSREEFIKNWADRTGTSFEVAWHNFCTNDMASAFFAVDPRRQNQHEKIAADWISKLPGVKNFRKLPASGPNSKYLKDGRIIDHDDLTNDENPKSIDFIWELEFNGTDSLKFYASHKHTEDDGGSQDNQYRELKGFTQQAAGLRKERSYRLISLADGHYYQRERARSSGKSYMDELKEIVSQTDYAEAMACSDLPTYLIGQIVGMHDRKGIAMPADVLALIDQMQVY
ncbi:hypothetical protein MASR1M60_13270 [Rhodocyclaceae bacterium]